jgi:hypothetical protein
MATTSHAHENANVTTPAAQSSVPDDAVTLFDGLGDHAFPITTSSPKAQAYVDQGLIFVYGFNHYEAHRSFAEAARLDASCAMCYWGQALALGPHINAPMAPDSVEAAFKAIQNAKRLASAASPREQAYINALSARYAADPAASRSVLDRGYADAMRELATAYPNDSDAAVLFSESLMNLVAWDYWNAQGEPRPETVEFLAALETVLDRAPDHPGALHYYIHAVENSPDPARAEAAADRLRDLGITIGHMIHMPSHIYARIGRWHDASAANEGALEDDRAYLAENQAKGMVPILYHPHNYHFLSWTAGMEGRSTVALNAADRLMAGTQPELAADMPFLNLFLMAPTLTRVQFGKWDDLMARAQPPEDALFLTAIAHYGRGFALTGKGSLEKARSEAAALAAIVNSESVAAFEQPEAFFPGATILRIADLTLRAEIALADNDAETAVRWLDDAVALQDGLAYMEPPYWPTSARLALGRALIAADRPERAERVYRADLDQYPNNGRALAGLTKSLRAQGKNDEASETAKRFEAAWAHADMKIAGY